MVSHRIKLLVILTLVVSLFSVQLLSWRIDASPAVLNAIDKLNGEWVDRPAPDFNLPMANGELKSLRDFRGKVVFLNFWASFCEPCREEMPSMESLVRQYQSQGMAMVAISFDPEKKNMVDFMNNFLPGDRSAMTVLWDPTSKTGTEYGTELIPETYIIDRDGRIVARFVNSYDWTRPEVKQLIEALLRDESASSNLL